jgi:hypothetical protein
MSSSSFWLTACKASEGRPLEIRLKAMYAGNIATVRLARVTVVAVVSVDVTVAAAAAAAVAQYDDDATAAAGICLVALCHNTEQVTAYCLSALASSTMFYLWWRMGREDRQRAWRLYGWYCGLMMCGSCFGAVAWASNMMVMEDVMSSGASSISSSRSSWLGVHIVTYAIEFLCLSAAKLLVLDRMLEFAAPAGASVWRHWGSVGLVVIAVVVLCNLTGLAACVGAAILQKKNHDAFSTAMSYAAANSTAKASEYFADAIKEGIAFHITYTVQKICEVVALMLIITAFLSAGALCARRIGVALRRLLAAITIRTFYNQSQAESPVLSDAMDMGKALRLKTLGIAAVVFAAFLLRSVLSIMFAVSSAYFSAEEQPISKCPGVESFCDACYEFHFLIANWMFFTPEFRPTVVLISSPLVLVVVLWSMTTKSIWQRMKLGRQEQAPGRSHF